MLRHSRSSWLLECQGLKKWRLSYSSASVVARFSTQQLNLAAASKPKVNRSRLPYSMMQPSFMSHAPFSGGQVSRGWQRGLVGQKLFPSYHASNSSRCSSSMMENSVSSPSWIKSFSVITTSCEDWCEVEAELPFSFRGCEVQRAAIKSDCCK